MTQPATSDVAESQLVLILDDDVMITEGLAAGLERPGRSIITCNDLESAELVVRDGIRREADDVRKRRAVERDRCR